MALPNTVEYNETSTFLDSLIPMSKAGLDDPRLRFHTYYNHIRTASAYLERQHRRYELLGKHLDRRVTGAIIKVHDDGIAEPLDESLHDSIEARTAEQTSPGLAAKGMSDEELEEVKLGILATGLKAELSPERPNDIVSVQADLHNVWAGHRISEAVGYKIMATNANLIRVEKENLKQVHQTLKEHQDEVATVLGGYMARDMAIADADRIPETGECIYNHVGKLYIAKYVLETPASLSSILGIRPAELA